MTKKNKTKFYDENGECIACGFIGVDLHHFKTQGAGGSNESYNLMPLCHKHHVMIHNISASKFMNLTVNKHGVNGKLVKEWLKSNGWYYDSDFNKWFNNGE